MWGIVVIWFLFLLMKPNLLFYLWENWFLMISICSIGQFLWNSLFCMSWTPCFACVMLFQLSVFARTIRHGALKLDPIYIVCNIFFFEHLLIYIVSTCVPCWNLRWVRGHTGHGACAVSHGNSWLGSPRLQTRLSSPTEQHTQLYYIL